MTDDDVLATGYVAGLDDFSEWLTVPGSTHRYLRDMVHDTRGAAEVDAQRLVKSFPSITVRQVQAVEHGAVSSGVAFRIIDPGSGSPVTYRGPLTEWTGADCYVSDGPLFRDGETQVDLVVVRGMSDGLRVVAEIHDASPDDIVARPGQRQWFAPR